ncbi:MAG: hypothetical protein AAF840_13105, partial [Bacteroidota bacterium]
DQFEEGREKISAEIQEQKDKLSAELKETKEKIGDSVDKGVKGTKRFVKKLFLGLFLLALIGGGIYMIYANYTFSEGTRSGYLIKISKKGYVFKTYEGQLNLGGFGEGGADEGIVGNTWEFSVAKDDVYEQLGKMEGKKVTLHYREIMDAMPWQGDTNYFITKVEAVE